MNKRFPQLGDLIRLNELEKVDVDQPLAMLSPTVGGLGTLAEKLEDNEQVIVGEIRRLVGDFSSSLKNMRVDYFGDELSMKEFGVLSRKNTKICKAIMDGKIEIDEGSYECELFHLPLGVARILKEMEFEFLSFENLRGLNIDALKQLSRGKIDHYHLSLPAAVLNLEKARFLAENWKDIGLDNVKGISLEILEELIQVENLTLDFDGIDLDTAKLLAKHKGYLGLNDLKKLSSEAAAELGKHDGDLNLGLSEIDSQVATLIAGNNGYLFLRQLENLDVGSARGLAEHRGGELRLGKRELNSVEVAEELIKCKEHLVLESLFDAPDAVVKVLASGNDVYAGPINDRLDQFRK